MKNCAFSKKLWNKIVKKIFNFYAIVNEEAKFIKMKVLDKINFH